MNYKTDRETALNKGYTFFVAQKLERGARWLHLRDDIADLHKALVQAQSHTAYEVGVFVVRDGLGYIYWTSREPDLYNTTVITS
jgi:hypothetical protein